MQRAIKPGNAHVFAGVHGAVEDTCDGEASQIVAVIEIRHKNLQRTGRIALWFGNGLDDRLEQRLQVFSGDFDVRGSGARLSVGVEDREIDLLFLGVEVDEKVVNLVQYFLWTCVGTVDLVDDQNRGQMSFKGLAQHVAGLRQRAFAGVDQQHDTVDHLERAFYFSAEVAVAGRVNNVDLDVVIEDRGILREDRDSALTLEIVGVHDALDEVLVGAKSAALPEHGVNQGGLTVVDMGDDCDIADAGIQKSEAFPRILKTESLYHFTMYLGFRSGLVFLSCCHLVLSF